MSRLVVLVDFRVKPADHDKFRPLIAANAAASVKNEPGCRQFDVVVPEDGTKGQFILYEVYDDVAAFDAHLDTDHFKTFDAATRTMITERKVIRLVFPVS